MRIRALSLALLLALPTAGAGQSRSNVGEATAKGQEIAFVLAVFRDLNPKSIETGAEYCGYIGITPGGAYVRTEHARGTEDTCRLPRWPRKWTVLASYHTHSTYSPDYDSERPSVQDMDSDRSNDIDGYIATPGGRLWHVDSDTMVARQICGAGCLPSDPAYIPDPPGTIKTAYTYRALVAIER